MIRPHPEGWQQVIDAQNRAYPKCKHGEPTAVIDFDDQPICPRCVAEDPAIVARFRQWGAREGGLK